MDLKKIDLGKLIDKIFGKRVPIGTEISSVSSDDLKFRSRDIMFNRIDTAKYFKIKGYWGTFRRVGEHHKTIIVGSIRISFKQFYGTIEKSHYDLVRENPY